MLSSSELQILNNIISDENKSFESIALNFQKSYSKTDQFKVGVALWFFLKDNLLNLSQRLASFFILYDIYKNEKVPTTPFVPIVLETLQSSKNKIEQKILVDFLQSNFTHQKSTIKEYKEERGKIEKVQIPDLTEYWNSYKELSGKYSKRINDWIRPVIYNKSAKDSKNIETSPPADLSQLTQEEVSFNYFEPNYLTYYPNSNYPFLEDEPMWIMPTLNYDFIWDYQMSPEKDHLAIILNDPLNNKPITDKQKDYALELVEKNPNLLKEIKFTPENLMDLIDKNDSFGCDILIKISKSIIFEQYDFIINYFCSYLTPFLSREFNQISMNVMSKIIQNVELPTVFIVSYINHLIENFKTEEKKDIKTKKARDISTFITNLINHGNISKEHNIMNDIQKDVR